MPGTKSGRRPADKRRMNRMSTGRCVPPSACMEIRLSVFPKSYVQNNFLRCPGNLGGARWKVVFWANRPVCIPSSPAPVRPAATPCAAPPRPARSISGLWIRQVNVYEQFVYPDKFNIYIYIYIEIYMKTFIDDPRTQAEPRFAR